MKFQTHYRICFFLISLVMTSLGSDRDLLAQDSKEDTYSISLVQVAEPDKETGKEIIQLDERKVVTESYTIRQGDHLWQLLRERGLLQKRNLQELLQVLTRLNSSLSNLNMLHPGEKLVIPLTITPLKGGPRVAEKTTETPPTPVPLETLKDLNLEDYTVKPGDSLIKVITSRYHIPREDLYDEYLGLLKKMNPSIRDLALIYPGQKLRLPVYSPQVVRMPVKDKEAIAAETEEEAPKEERVAFGQQLGEIVTLMGVEWMKTGQHFIPLKAGGQVNLKADSFPVISLPNGNRVVVDLQNELPEKMASLITSNWENYRIVHLKREDDLRRALTKILAACDFPKVYASGEHLELVGDISLRLSADWIVQMEAASQGRDSRTVMITILDPGAPRISRPMRNLLEGRGITVVDYPQGDELPGKTLGEPDMLAAGRGTRDLVETLLNLTGKPFASNVEIPVYQQKKTEFNLIVKADFFLTLDGRDSIIDLTGLGPEVLSLLTEHQFRVLPLSAEQTPSAILSRTLRFLGVQFDFMPHSFLAAQRQESRNVRLTVPGIVFSDKQGQELFATEITLPDTVTRFLSEKGYRILSLQ